MSKLLAHMHSSQEVTQLKTLVIEQTNTILESTLYPRKPLLSLAEILASHPQSYTDTALLQAATIIEFLAKQVQSDNVEYITIPIIHEGCRYVLDKLTQ